MTVHCTACREQNGNKIYYTNLRKVWKERSGLIYIWEKLEVLYRKHFFRIFIEVGNLNYWIKKY
ncbi:MAG: hypothetical protein CM1200mP30_31020 [Pseudomonadota bacterium]|nr:MAG: hypothetical protein CM1200mP30_31020 [Pseudomonadota bacterium]